MAHVMWVKFLKRYLTHQSLKLSYKLPILNSFKFPGSPWLKIHIYIAAKVLLFELLMKMFKMYIKM